MVDKEKAEAKLVALRQELKEVKGTKCEVYSRVCGYLRPVQAWNKGKKEEFALRKKFNCGC